MPSVLPPDGWLAADPSDLGTDMTASWWGTKIDIDETVFESGDCSIVFLPDTSGTVWLTQQRATRVEPGQRLKARSRVMNDNWSTTESRFLVGIAFYDSDGDYIDARIRDSFGISISAFNNLWTTATVEASVNDFSGAAYARAAVGRASTSGDTNTLWCDAAGLVPEPAFQNLTRYAVDGTQTISGAGNTQVNLLYAEVNAEGIYRHSSGYGVVIEGGTYVVSGCVELTLSDGAVGYAMIGRGVYGGVDVLSTETFPGAELHYRTGDLTRYCPVTLVERFNSGDLISLYANTSGAGTIVSAFLRAVRVGA